MGDGKLRRQFMDDEEYEAHEAGNPGGTSFVTVAALMLIAVAIICGLALALGGK